MKEMKKISVDKRDECEEIYTVRPTFIECPNVKEGCHTVGPKGLAHRVPRPLK